MPVQELARELEKVMLREEQVRCPVTHHFGPGLYVRQVEIPAGTFAIGHHQNFEQMNLFLKGSVSILKEDGTVERLTAPMIFTGRPGRKVGYIHEDMVWLNIYSTTERDVEKLEAHFLTKSEVFNETYYTNKIEVLKSELARQDFKSALHDIGVDAETVSAQSKNESDHIELPFSGYRFKVSDSQIHGRGVFATSPFASGDIIGPARIGERRTILGRFTNHSGAPNAKMVVYSDDSIYLVATSNIEGCRAGFDGDEITVDYRAAYTTTVKFNLERKGGI
jgi:hypothetical protein